MINESGDNFSLASRRVIRFSVAYVVLVVVINVLALAGLTAIETGAADPAGLGTQTSVAVLGTIAGLVGLICFFGVVISIVIWIISAHQLRRAGPGFVGYFCLSLSTFLVLFGYVVPAQMSSVGPAAAVELATRIGGVAVLIAGVVVARTRISRDTGRPDLVSRQPLVTSKDWDSSQWDPEVQHDIERRRRSEQA